MTRKEILHHQEKISVWINAFQTMIERISSYFSRSKVHERCQKYIQGLLSSVERKNGWQLAEYAGDSTPYGIQHLLGRARWDEEAVRDDLQQYVWKHFWDPEGVLVIDETGFIKKGKQSVGVQRQYSGTAGRVENCQIGVFLCYASSKGHAFLDRKLYLPKSWTEDPSRCQKAGVPSSVTFATKPALARQMLEHVFQTQPPSIPWVTADTVYGGNRDLREWFETQNQAYVLAVSAQEAVAIGGKKYQTRELSSQTSEAHWQRLSCGNGSKGPRMYDWASYTLDHPDQSEWERSLLIRRHPTKEEEYAYYVTYAPIATSLETLVQVAGTRWTVERCFQEAKGEVGLDHYEVRSWIGWYRHITLAMWAHAFLAAMRAQEIPADSLKRGTPIGKNSHFQTFKQRWEC